MTRTVDDLQPADLRLPAAGDGQVIGLFGGSFNPPHAGHVHVSSEALKRCRLDQIWWLVTPGNPLKDHSDLLPLRQRLALCRALNRDRRVRITAFEAAHDLTYSAQTIDLLLALRPRLHFVWVMGADNLAGFHRWRDWQRIAASLPIVVVDRPGSTLSFLSAKAAIALSDYRIDESDAELIGRMRPPAWTFLHPPRNALSSTAIREAGGRSQAE